MLPHLFALLPLVENQVLAQVYNPTPMLTVLALQGKELLLDTSQLALQGLYSGPVVILELPQLLPVGLPLGLNLGRQVSLGLGQV